MRYEDFTLQIESNADGGYGVTLLESPVGQMRERWVAQLDAEKHAAALDGQIAAGEKAESGGQPRGESLPRDLGDLKHELGLPLYEALLGDRLAQALEASLAQIETRQSHGEDCGLRLKLFFGRPPIEEGGRDPALMDDVVRFATAPWEYITRPRNLRFLALSRTTPVIRRVEAPESILPLKVKPPLRVLVVMSSPLTHGGRPLVQLDLAGEKQKIIEAIRGTQQVELEVLLNPSFKEVAEELRNGKYHGLHFMGHGGFHEETGEGVLLFVGPNREAEPKTGEEIAFELAEYKTTLRLVVLNSCRGGEITRRPGLDPFASVALAIVEAGIPAVIAMQHPISDDAAIAFSGELYSELRAGHWVEEALTEARREMHKISAEWGTPVLYLRPRDGQLFDHEPAPIRDREEAPPAVRLGIRSMQGWGMELTRECAYLLDLLPAFHLREIRKQADWNGKVLPKIQRFLARYATDKRPLELIMPAHISIAFAAGYFFEPKSGHDLRVYQRGATGTEIWRLDEGAAPTGDLWRPEPAIEVDPGSPDVAVVVSVSRAALQDVRDYLEVAGIPVRAILHAATPKLGQTAVASGAHAWALAEALSERIRHEGKRPTGGVLHLFLAAPNAFCFFLGRLARPFGRVQLYEYDLEQSQGGSYRPSITIIPRSLGKLERVESPAATEA